MSVDTTMAVLYAQSGLSNQANAAMVAPQAALAMTRVLAAEQMRQEREQVEKSEKTEEGKIRKDNGKRRGAFFSRLRVRHGISPDEEPEEPVSQSPTIGNLLNVKV